jgi:hypothetical protein
MRYYHYANFTKTTPPNIPNPIPQWKSLIAIGYYSSLIGFAQNFFKDFNEFIIFIKDILNKKQRSYYI